MQSTSSPSRKTDNGKKCCIESLERCKWIVPITCFSAFIGGVMYSITYTNKEMNSGAIAGLFGGVVLMMCLFYWHIASLLRKTEPGKVLRDMNFTDVEFQKELRRKLHVVEYKRKPQWLISKYTGNAIILIITTEIASLFYLLIKGSKDIAIVTKISALAGIFIVAISFCWYNLYRQKFTEKPAKQCNYSNFEYYRLDTPTVQFS